MTQDKEHSDDGISSGTLPSTLTQESEPMSGRGITECEATQHGDDYTACNLSADNIYNPSPADVEKTILNPEMSWNETELERVNFIDWDVLNPEVIEYNYRDHQDMVEGTGPKFEESIHDRCLTAPDASLIRIIHRNPDAYITLHHKTDTLHEIGAVVASELEDIIIDSSINDAIGTDSYFSINGFREAKSKVKRRGQNMTFDYLTPPETEYGLLLPWRAQENVQYLNACYIDIDYHKYGLEKQQVYASIHSLEESGELPKASIYEDSGRGCWLFWLLGDENGGIEATPDTCELHKRIQSAFYIKLVSIGADGQALDISRITRVPGSVNSKSDTRVQYYLASDETGDLLVYELDELADILAIDKIQPDEINPPANQGKCAVKGRIVSRSTKQRAPSRTSKRTKKVPNRRRGWEALRNNMTSDIEKLGRIRGGFAEGCRHMACRAYAAQLYKYGLMQEEINRRVQELADKCKPPLPCQDVAKAIDEADILKKLPPQTISDWVGVTPQEAYQLKTLPHAERYASDVIKDEIKPNRNELREIRHRVIRELKEEGVPLTPIRKFTIYLKEYKGINTSKSTVQRDLKELFGDEQPDDGDN